MNKQNNKTYKQQGIQTKKQTKATNKHLTHKSNK